MPAKPWQNSKLWYFEQAGQTHLLAPLLTPFSGIDRHPPDIWIGLLAVDLKKQTPTGKSKPQWLHFGHLDLETDFTCLGVAALAPVAS